MEGAQLSMDRLLLLLLFLANACLALPATPQQRTGGSGVYLNNREKGQQASTCPPLGYCTCKTGRKGLDVTCDGVNSNQLQRDCDILRQKERKIRYFKIRNGYIPKLQNHIFMGIKVEHLYLHNNSMNSLGPQSLSSQGKILSHLVLSTNHLTEVPTKAIGMLSELIHLNLNDNNITALREEAFLGLKKVTRLTLYDNQISYIHPHAFDGLTSFRERDSNNLDTRDLRRLNLGKNHIKQVPYKSLLALTQLQILDFTENQITKLEENAFQGLENLDSLTLNANKLTSLGPRYFVGMEKLTTLYLDMNKIKTISPEAFEGLEEHLQTLSMAFNLIEAFPSKALRRFHRLEVVHLGDNKIKMLPEDSFKGFGEHIKDLWLGDNYISEIPPSTFEHLHSLQWIKMHNNRLKTLTYELMEPVLDTLVHIDIHSNPLECDCELRWYRQWIEDEWNEVEEQWLKLTQCTDPTDNREHNIAEVPLKDMFCTADDIVDDDGGGACTLNAGSIIALTLFTALFQSVQ